MTCPSPPGLELYGCVTSEKGVWLVFPTEDRGIVFLRLLFQDLYLPLSWAGVGWGE